MAERQAGEAQIRSSRILRTSQDNSFALTTRLLGLILTLIIIASIFLAPAAHGQVSPNSLIADMISKIDTSEIYGITLSLQNFKTRRFGTSGNNEATAYLYNKLISIPQLKVEYQGNYSNIIATLPGWDTTSNAVYIVGAHFDSANFVDQNLAPGATDNGAGTAIVLELARIMSQYRFRHTLKFILWNAEENECYGSIEYVKYAREKNINIALYVNFDTGAYDPNNRMILDILSNSQSTWVSNMMANLNSLYGINFALTYNIQTCLSDHRPFWNYGYNAVSTHSESHGPQYHTPYDTVDKVSTTYAKKNGQLGMSVLATLAEPAPIDTTPPVTVDNYDWLWHTSDFAITVSASDDVAIGETYYRINQGPTLNVKVNGMPNIISEGAGNTLEYWSVDAAGNEESPHKMITGIKLDKTTPSGSVLINNDDALTSSTSVSLTLTANDATSGVSQVRYSNDGTWDTETWETPVSSKPWTLTLGDGAQTVYYQLKDNAGLTTSYSDTITLDTTPPTSSLTINAGPTYTNTTALGPTSSALSAGSSVPRANYSGNNAAWSNSTAYSNPKPSNLNIWNSTRNLSVQYKNLTSSTLTARPYIILDIAAPEPNAGQNQSTKMGTPSNSTTTKAAPQEKSPATDRIPGTAAQPWTSNRPIRTRLFARSPWI